MATLSQHLKLETEGKDVIAPTSSSRVAAVRTQVAWFHCNDTFGPWPAAGAKCRQVWRSTTKNKVEFTGESLAGRGPVRFAGEI